jgi:heptosyltransferase-2
VKPKLLIVELWGLGDLVLATPFLRAAAEKFEVSLVAKPYAQDLQARLWPGVDVLPFVAPWTAFRGKYVLHRWPWPGLFALQRRLRRADFEVGLSARWDPRDHFLLWRAHARMRIGFPRLGSGFFLTRPVAKPDPREHRYEYWRVLGRELGLALPAREAIPLRVARPGGPVLVHSGAGQPVRVWPLEHYRHLVARLRAEQHLVTVACDADQREWWLRAGESEVATPRSVTELFTLLDGAGVMIGNDSGPGHLAAFCGVPTLTLFGPQLPEWFAPLHPETVCLEGKPCPYKPCSDDCRFAAPVCLQNITEEEVWAACQSFLRRQYSGESLVAAAG